ncbi:hypothetical protein PsYK624_080920 [Phanerochaete sordida]|uniref:Uncharacterized protein n=1 Tax=Phanerochaete sordida TaxID=48140 RepID=A0A9P3GC33_9APHY|nr:hypothetical protein PsYK624_080920 [Phanerochaete sordida]
MAARTLLFSHVADVWKSLHTVTLGPLSSLAITAEIQTALLNSSMKEFRCHVKDMEVCIRRGTMKIILEGGRVTRVTCFGVPAEAGMRNYLHEKGLSQHSHKFTFLPASMLWSKMERK